MRIDKIQSPDDEMRPDILMNELKAALIIFFSTMDEKQRRLYAGYESLKIGHGGDKRISSVVNRRPDKDTLHFAACAISQTIGLIPHCLSVLKLFRPYIKTVAGAVKMLISRRLIKVSVGNSKRVFHRYVILIAHFLYGSL
jgi:hypothetical protein